MKKNLILIIFLISLISSVSPSFAGEERDYGVRLDFGRCAGIGNELQYEVGIGSDFYFLSDDFRMTFGTIFIIPNSGYIPLTAVHYLGLEYVLYNQMLIGTSYNKSYLREIKNNLGGNKCWSYYLGYKHAVSELHDLFLLFGTISQPFTQSTADPNFPLSENTMFIRVGSEWYF